MLLVLKCPWRVALDAPKIQVFSLVDKKWMRSRILRIPFYIRPGCSTNAGVLYEKKNEKTKQNKWRPSPIEPPKNRKSFRITKKCIGCNDVILYCNLCLLFWQLRGSEETFLFIYLFFIYLFIYRQFYSTRESARYKMPGWFVSVGQVGVSESPPSTTPCPRSRVAHVRPPR